MELYKYTDDLKKKKLKSKNNKNKIKNKLHIYH